MHFSLCIKRGVWIGREVEIYFTVEQHNATSIQTRANYTVRELKSNRTVNCLYLYTT